MAGTFSRVQRKLSRAGKHLSEARAVLRRIESSDALPLDVQTRVDDYNNEFIEVRMGTVEREPSLFLELGEIIADAVHNLRVTLDHLMWELAARKLGYRPREMTAELRNLAFPVFLQRPKFHEWARRESVRKLTLSRQRKQLEAIQPFGNPRAPLALLPELDNQMKHRHAPVLAEAHDVKIREPDPSWDGRLVLPIDGARKKQRRLRFIVAELRPQSGRRYRSGSLVARVRVNDVGGRRARERYVYQSLHRAVEVRFGPGSIAEGQRVASVLDSLERSVTQTLDLFKPEFPV